MADDKVVRFPGRFEAEIAVAERAYDVIMERLARGRLPDDVAADGDAAAVLDAIGELLHLNAMDVDGRRISRKKTEASVEALESAVYRLADWPAVPRVLAMAPIIEALEKLEVDWLASELVGLLPEQPEEAPHDDDIFEAIARISLACLRIMLRAGVWDESFEGPLRAVREWSLGRAEDDELKQTLSQAVVFHAILGRQSLLEEERRRMADAEPLPNELMAALDDFAADMTSEKLVRWSLHLVIADALAAGLVPEWAKPKHLVAAAELAVVREDDPDVELDLLKFARWARIKPKDLRTLRDKVAEALVWMPPGYEDSVEDRQEERWRVESGTMESLPVRWAADGPVEECPPYSPEAAVTRIEELRDVVWMMIDPVEPLQFVASAFRFGDDAPEVMDEETVSRIIDLWEEERVVDVDRGEDDDVEDWEDDRVDEGGGGPALVTTDGEPLVLCTGEYEFEDRDRAEIIRRLDAIAELEREQDDGSHRWVWMEERDGQNLLIGSIEVEEARLSVDTMSVARATRIGARLDEQLGELTVMIDLSTERVTPAMMARRERGAPGDGERPSVTTDDEWAVVHSAMARHYRGWLNEEIPALGGMTPREAVQDPEGRQRVVALLRNMEELQASAPEAMRGFDFGFLWRQLGLDRDEP